MLCATSSILLLEDNASDLRFMKYCLRELPPDIEFCHVTTLAQAEEKLSHEEFNLVVADLNVPDARGLETFLRIQKAAGSAAVVVMTGMDDTDLATRAVEAGAQDYLVKGDLPPKKVLRCISNALERHDQLNKVAVMANHLQRENTGLRKLSQIDPLTVLSNRRGFQKALREYARSGNSGSVILVDVDDFKRINDIFGFQCGDRVLKDVSRKIRSVLHDEDAVARVGGDEFLVLLNKPISAAMDIAEKIRSVVDENSNGSNGGAPSVTVSMGIAPLPVGHTQFENILAMTQNALNVSKGNGKNRICCTSDLLLDDNSLKVQETPMDRRPFFNLETGKVAGWEFYSSSEDNHRVPMHVFDAGAALRAKMRAMLGKVDGLEGHLHLSPSELLFLQPGDFDQVTGPDLDRRKTFLSISEVPLSPLPQGLLNSIRRLQAAGWSFALHGFGLGAHSWASLIQIAPSCVILSESLTAGVTEDQDRLRNLTRICRSLHTLGSATIATGVETRAEAEVLRHLNVDRARGPLWEDAS